MQFIIHSINLNFSGRITEKMVCDILELFYYVCIKAKESFQFQALSC